jgi:acyl-CoA thioesterase-1|tara:strand:+ start:23672 stop:24358 length:687 start_codon:yes stop_codon:yes gene_type:complete
MKPLINRLLTPFYQSLSRFAAVAIACILPSMVFSQPTWAAQPSTLLVFGDSLSAAYGMKESQGWVRLLETQINQSDLNFSVVNGSISGETSTGGLARLPAMLENYSPDIVILELGGNDGLRGLPLAALEKNMRTMVDLISQSGAETLLTGIQIPPNYGPRYTEPFFDIYEKIAKSQDLSLVPFLIDGIPQQPDLMQADGIHPKAEAQYLILENVWPYLEELLRQTSAK